LTGYVTGVNDPFLGFYRFFAFNLSSILLPLMDHVTG